MAYYINPTRKAQVFVNSVDYSDTFISFQCTDDSANRNGIVTTTGEVIIGDNGTKDLQSGYRRDQFKRGQPVIVNIMGDSGSWIRHPRGTLVVLGVNYDIRNAQLVVEVGCILAHAILRDDSSTYNLVKPYCPYILPPDRNTWQNVGGALAASGRFIYQNNAGGITAASYFGEGKSDAVSVLGVTTLDAANLTGAGAIPDTVTVSYEYPVIEKEPSPGEGEEEIGDGELNDPCMNGGCRQGYICEDGRCRPDPANGACYRDPDCELGFICINGTCSPDPRNRCEINYDCRYRREGRDCVSGYCGNSPGGNPCLFDNQCADGFFCNDEYTCETRNPECRQDFDCPGGSPGFLCTFNECQPNPTDRPCNSDFDCGEDERYSCVGAVCTNTEGDECTPSRSCADGYYCDYGQCKPINDEDEDGIPDDPDDPEGPDDDDPLDGKVVRVVTNSSYSTSYPAIAFIRKPADDDPNLARIKRLEQKQKELAKVTGCGNSPDEPDDLGPTSCADDYETKRTNVTVNVNRSEETLTEYKGPGYAVSRRERFSRGPAFELNRQYYGDKFAFCRATWATGCQPNGNCSMEGQETILTGKDVQSNFYDKQGTIVKTITENYETILSAAIPDDWRAGVKNGIPEGFKDGLSTALFLARQVTVEYTYSLNSTKVETTTWESKATATGSGISSGDLDATRGIKKKTIESSFGKNLNPPIEDEDDLEDGDGDEGSGSGPDTSDPDGAKPFDPYDPSTWPRVPPGPLDPPFDPNDPSTWPPKRSGFDEDDPSTWPGPDRDEDGNPIGYDPLDEPRYTTTFLTDSVTELVGAGAGPDGNYTDIVVRENLPVPLYGLEKAARKNIATIYARYLAQWEKGSALGVQVTEFLRQEWITAYKPGIQFHYYDPAAEMLLVLRMDGTTWVVNSEECTLTTDGIYRGSSNGTVVIPSNTELS